MSTCRYCKGHIAPRTGHHPVTVIAQDGFDFTWRCDVKGVELEMVTACPDCGSGLLRESSAQLPLIRHGGYGEIHASHIAWCRCGFVLNAGMTSENPRSLA